jgi:shikimate kinase
MVDKGPQIIRSPISLADVRSLAEERFGDMLKACVDVGRSVIALGGELHSDEEALLLADGARQDDLWGINLYLDEPVETWIEFDSMINVRPRSGNRTRGVEDVPLQRRIVAIVAQLIPR